MDDRLEYYIKNRNELIGLLPEEYNRVLEVGCGEGKFRDNLKEACKY
jgi:hypothetical protein